MPPTRRPRPTLYACERRYPDGTRSTADRSMRFCVPGLGLLVMTVDVNSCRRQAAW